VRALLDANVVLRTLLPSDNPQRAVAVVLEAAYDGRFQLLATDELLDEVRRKATSKPALARLVSQSYLRDALATFSRSSILLPRLLPPLPARYRDPCDDYLLAYAEAGHADFLVTYDDDLLVLHGALSFGVVSPPAFLTILRDHGLV